MLPQRGLAFAAYTVAALHGASVAFRRLAPVAAVVGLLSTAGVYGLALGLPVFMLGPAVLFVAYGVGVGLGLGLRTAAVLLGVIEAALVLLLSVRFHISRVGLGPAVRRSRGRVLVPGRSSPAGGRPLPRSTPNGPRSSKRRATELARHAVAAERLRIARELHDVVAHSMSVIAMHAGAARLAVGTDPDVRAGGAGRHRALQPRGAGRDAATGHRAARRERGRGGAEPGPGLADLPTLVASVAAAG